MEVKIKDLVDILINHFNFDENDTIILVEDDNDLKIVNPDAENTNFEKIKNTPNNEVRGVSSEENILSFIEKIRQQMEE